MSTIQEVREAKRVLEAMILKEIKAFEETHEVAVTYIDHTTGQSMSDPRHFTHTVELRIDL